MKKRNRRLLREFGHYKLKRAIYHAIAMRETLRLILVWAELGEVPQRWARSKCLDALRGNGK